MKRSHLLLPLAALAAALLCLTACSSPSTDQEADGRELDLEAAAGKHHVEIAVENYGVIAVELDGDSAPISVANFLDLAGSGFYDGLTFHRIISGFVIQGGDPVGNGTGGSEYPIKGEFSDNGVENPLTHVRGAVAMARRSNDMDSATSQFYICHADAHNLDGQYAVFGQVTDGMDIVDQICQNVTPVDGNGTVNAEDQPVITSVTVID